MMQIKSTFAFPSTWRNAEVCEVGSVITGNTPSKKDSRNYDNYIPFIKPPQLLDTIVDQCESYLSASGAEIGRIAPPFSILVSCIGNLGKTGINRIPIAFNQQINAILPYCGIEPLFLFYQTQSDLFRQQLEEFSSATTIPIINKGNFERLILQIAPFNEQHRIVAKIEELFSELDKGIESLKTARAKLNIYRQAVLKHAFEGKLTAQWREENKDKLETPEQLLARIKQEREARYEQQLHEWKATVKTWEEGKRDKRPTKPSKVKTTTEIAPEEVEDLPNISGSWCYVRLCRIAEIRLGMSVSAARKIEDPLEVPYLRVANVQRGFLDLSEIKYMSIERAQLDSLQLKKWDVLFNEGGDRDKLGRGWIWQSEIAPCITQNHVFRASPYITSEFNSKLLSYWANTFGQQYFEKVGKQTTNLASINKTVLSKFPVPLIPSEEQEELCRQIDQALTILDTQERVIASALGLTGLLRQSILAKAFSGQLVPQDLDDEPASILLERIKAEKAARSQNNTRVKRRRRKATA